MQKKFYIVIASLVAIGGGLLFLTRPHVVVAPKDSFPMLYGDKSVFLSAIRSATATPQVGVTGLTVPHHLLAVDLAARAFKSAAENSYERIIIMCPDHYWLGDKPISVANRNFATVFGELPTDFDFVKKLKQLSFVSGGDFFYREHGIQAITPFVRYYFPQTPVVAVAIKEDARQPELDEFFNFLATQINKRTLIIQSTDFSHYLSADQAAKSDQETLKILSATNSSDILNLKQPDQIDSKAAQYVQMRLQREYYYTKMYILDHKNSQDYSKKAVSSTTSYLTELFK